MTVTLTDEQRDYLRSLIEDARERAQDHIEWLASESDEEDKDQQRAECERSIEIGASILSLLT